MNLRSFIKTLTAKIPFQGSLKFHEPMSRHTTLKTGGPADLWIRPWNRLFPTWTKTLLEAAETEGIPVFFLGRGANLLVSDKGIRGIVLDTGSWQSGSAGLLRSPLKSPFISPSKTPLVEEKEEGDLSVKVLSGSSVDDLADYLAARSLSGLEFLAGMPGSVGGAVWMNARCYGKSVSDVLMETEILDENRCILSIPFFGGLWL